MPFSRYVALGDSFTEGVGDPDPDRPNGLRGWADRVAEVLAGKAAAAGAPFGYANLAVRGRMLAAVLKEQVPPALGLRPDLVTIYAGANDIMRPRVDLDALAEQYDEGLAALSATGATLVVFTAFDPGGSAIYRPLRGRFALYNEAVRWSADRYGARVVDFWRLREYRDWRYWDDDRLHLSPVGHQRMAIAVLDVLGIGHDAVPLPLPDRGALSRRQQLHADLAWTRGFLAPWLHRRLTGRSSGDLITPKYPELGTVGAGRFPRSAGETGP